MKVLVLGSAVIGVTSAWYLRRAGHEINRERMLRLSRYSHDCLVALRGDTGIHYDERTGGVLELLRTEQELNEAADQAAMLDRWNVHSRLLDRAGCVAHEPALRMAHEKITGGMLLPGDESGDCLKFTRELARRAETRGVRFALSTSVDRLTVDDKRIARVMTDKGEMTADTYVLACGSYSPLLLRPLGIRLPVYPVKGYSTTIEIDNDAAAPAGTLTDATYKIVITRLGDKLRGAGTAELAGYDLSLRPARLGAIKHVMADLFPDAVNQADALSWCGLRPMTPDNPPILGATTYKNLFLNTGHGTLGWTMACGSGKILADIVSGRPTDIDLKGLTLARFS